MSFVDGGYVDNSGVATATKLARVLSYVSEPGRDRFPRWTSS